MTGAGLFVSQSWRRLSRTFAKFLLAGVAGAIVQYSILVTVVQFVGHYPVTASAAGYLLGAIANYVINYHVTFRSSRPHSQAIRRFSTVVALGLTLNSALMTVFVHWYHIQYLISQVATTALVLLWNFAAHANWSFSHPNNARHDIKL